MLITLHRHGGIAAIPGLELRVTVDTDTLPAEKAAELERAVRDAKIEQFSSSAPGAARDQRQYDLTIQDGSRTRSAVLRDPIPTQELRELVKLLTSQGGSAG